MPTPIDLLPLIRRLHDAASPRGYVGSDRPALPVEVEATLATALVESPHLAPHLAEYAAAQAGYCHQQAAEWQRLAAGSERVAQIARAVSPIPDAATVEADLARSFADLDALAGDAPPEIPDATDLPF